MNTYPTSDSAPGKWASIALTVLVHLALALFLFFGIRWQSEPAAPLEVGLSAAPPPAPRQTPPPQTPPQPQPVPKPTPKPPQETPPVQPPAPVKPPVTPEVAVKKPQEKEKPPVTASKPPPKKEESPQSKKPVEKPAEKPPVTPVKKEPPPAADPLDTQYLDNLLKQETERTQRNNANADLQQRLEAETRRIASNRGMDAYQNAIRTKIRGNLLKPPGLTGNPEAVFMVEQLPSGEVIRVRLVRSSGIPALDEAIERSIHRSSPLPLPEQRELFQREIALTFRPLE